MTDETKIVEVDDEMIEVGATTLAKVIGSGLPADAVVAGVFMSMLDKYFDGDVVFSHPDDPETRHRFVQMTDH